MLQLYREFNVNEQHETLSIRFSALRGVYNISDLESLAHGKTSYSK